MKKINLIIGGLLMVLASAVVLLVSGSAHASPGPFTCSSNFYQMLGKQLELLDPTNGTYTTIGSPASNNINGIGYDTLNNYMYGFYTGGTHSGDLVKIASDGTITDLGAVSGLPDSPYNNGAFDNSGNLYVQSGSSNNIFYKIDVATMTATSITITGNNVKAANDLAYINGNIYVAVAASISVVNLTTDTNTNATLSGLPAGTYGADWSDVNGQWFVSNNTTGGIYQITNYNTASPIATLQITGTGATSNDGANCDLASAPVFGPGSDVSVTVSHSGDFTRGSTGQFVISTNNSLSSDTASGLFTVTDTLPDGLTPTSASGTDWDCNIVGQAVTCTNTDSIDPGDGLPDLTLDVNVASDASSSLDNTADLVFTNNTNSSPSSTDTVNIDGENVGIVVSHSGDFTRGSEGDFTLSVTNNTTEASADGPFTVTDTLPDGLTPTSASGTDWDCNIVGQAVTCTNNDNIAGGDSLGNITLATQVSDSASDSLDNTASVSFADNINTDPSSTDTVTMIGEDVSVDVSHSGDFTRGSTGQFTIGVSNDPSSDTAGGPFTVTDTLPDGLTPTSASGTDWDCNIVGQAVTCTNNDSIDGGDSLPDITLNVNVASDADSSIDNTADLAFTDNINSNPTSTDTVSIDGEDVSINVSHTSNFSRSGTGQFTISLTNNTTEASADGPFTVTDTLPDGLTPTSASGTDWDCNIVGQAVTCTNNDSIDGGDQSSDITVDANVADDAASSIDNTASVDFADNIDSSPSDTDTIAVDGEGVSVDVSHSGDFTRGSSGDFTLSVTNNTLVAAASGLFTVTDTLPDGLTPTSASGTDWDCNIVGQAVTCTNTDSIDPGDGLPDLTLDVNVASDASSSLDNTADLVFTNNTNSSPSSTDTVNIDGENVGIVVSHSGDFTRGSEGDFTLSVTNNTTEASADGPFTVTDTLPDGLTPTSASGTDWDCNIVGQAVTCTNNDNIAGGDSLGNITLATQVSDSASDSLDNTASVSFADNINTDPSSTDTVTIAGDSDGVSDAIENAAPNNGDANDDGIPDSQEPNVTSLVDPVTNAYAVLANTGCNTNEDVTVASATAQDGDYSYPAGLMNFSLSCPVGATATITMYYYGLSSANGLVLRKYDPNTHTYSTVSSAVFSVVTIGGQTAVKISYQVTDGGPLDEDGIENGTIVDPAGPAELTSSPDVSTTSTDSGISAPNTGYGVPSTVSPLTMPLLAVGFISLSLGLLITVKLELKRTVIK